MLPSVPATMTSPPAVRPTETKTIIVSVWWENEGYGGAVEVPTMEAALTEAKVMYTEGYGRKRRSEQISRSEIHIVETTRSVTVWSPE